MSDQFKLYQGDCLRVMQELIDKGIKVDCVLTDIPYNGVNTAGEERAKYGGQLRKFDKGKADVLTFDLTAFCHGLEQLSTGSIYIFCGITQVASIMSYYKERSKDFMVRHCIWEKTNPPPTNGQHMWLSSFENCVFIKRRKQLFKAHCKSSVWRYPCGKSKVHPTEKPVDLFSYLIETSTDEWNLVLDPCMGSGTTGVACANLNRKFIGIELDPVWFDLAVDRIKEAKNKKDNNKETQKEKYDRDSN